MNAGFDQAAHELEIQLRELRRLVSDFAVLPVEMETAIDGLGAELDDLGRRVAEVRGRLLEDSQTPLGVETDPFGGDPVRRLAYLREMEATARELGLPFDGGDEIAVLAVSLGEPQDIE